MEERIINAIASRKRLKTFARVSKAAKDASRSMQQMVQVFQKLRQSGFSAAQLAERIKPLKK